MEIISEPQVNNSEEGKRKWRKKRKTFLSNAKKYARKGQLGRGTKMPEDTYQYFVGILEVMKKGVDTEEEKLSLVNNVLDRTRGEEISIVGNQLGCRVIELLLPYASPADLERYMEALTPELRRLSADNFSSHVIEKLLTVSSERATDHLQDDTGAEATDNEDSDSETPKKKIKIEKKETIKKYTTEHIQKCHEFTVKIGKYALNNMEDFVFDMYANHILRSAMRCLSGITLIPGEKLKKNVFKDVAEKNVVHKSIPPHTTKMKYRTVPQEFKDIVREYAERLSQWPQFKDMPYKNITSGLIQIMLYAIKAVDEGLMKNILRKLLDESFAPSSSGDVDDDKKNDASAEKIRPAVFASEPAIRCLEAALLVAKKKTYTQIYARCFIGHLSEAVTMPALNFTVQRLLDNCQVKEELEMMFDELGDSFSAVMACGNTGVLVALVKACERLKARQKQFISSLEAALQVSEEPRRLPAACLRLVPAREAQPPGYVTSIHGSLVLQSMLRFQRPTKVVNALLELSQEELVYIFCDAKGCHVADAFFMGPFVGVKSRDKMIWLLKGSYQQLAMSKYGSRAFEVIFEACSMEQKVKIMSEISEKGQLLNSTPCGRLLAEKLMLHQFRSSAEKWAAEMARRGKRKDLFGDILTKKRSDSASE